MKTQEAISNARQGAANAWANSQKAMKESWTAFQNKKAWNDEKSKWSNNTNQWNKLTPQERCYLSSLVRDDCAENQYFDKRITEIIQHLVAAHEILKQYHEQKVVFDAADSSVTHPGKTHQQSIDAKKQVQKLRDAINALPSLFQGNVEKAQSKLRRIPPEKFEMIRDRIFDPAAPLFDVYPKDVIVEVRFDTSAKAIVLDPPTSLQKVRVRTLCYS